tara:strand:- start:566 stop:853 length:288 start_codon:yes stop_codon:yes gene_type:complete
MTRPRRVHSLKKSLRIAIPILKSSVRQLKILSPQNGTWQNYEDEGYQEESDALEALQAYLLFLEKTENDVKIRAEEKTQKPKIKEKTILYPEDCL